MAIIKRCEERRCLHERGGIEVWRLSEVLITHLVSYTAMTAHSLYPCKQVNDSPFYNTSFSWFCIRINFFPHNMIDMGYMDRDSKVSPDPNLTTSHALTYRVILGESLDYSCGNDCGSLVWWRRSISHGCNSVPVYQRPECAYRGSYILGYPCPPGSLSASYQKNCPNSISFSLYLFTY